MTALIGFLCLSGVARATDVTAYVDRTQVVTGHSIQLTVSIQGERGEVDIDPIKDFKVVPRGTSTSVQIVNERVSREINFNYTLIPLKSGTLTIPPLTVTTRGKRFQTQEIIITASESENSGHASDDITVSARVNNPAPYIGQPIIYTFELANAIQIRDPQFQKPEFSGFIAEDIEDSQTYKSIIKGRPYQVSRLKYVLIPIRSDRLTIKPGTLHFDLVRRRRGPGVFSFDSFFNNGFLGNAELEPRILKTDPVTVDVVPLPEYSGNVPFSGLVGKFDVKAEIETSQLRVGDSATLSVSIEGSGNIKDAASPELKIPENFKIYKDTPEEKIQLDMEVGYTGKKIFRSALVPVADGRYLFEPIQLVYFDVKKGAYVTKSTTPFSVNVSAALKKDELEIYSGSENNSNKMKKKVEFTGRDILSLKEDISALETEPALSVLGFISCLLAPAILFIAVIFTHRRVRKSNEPAVIMAEKADKCLKEACGRHELKEDFLLCLNKAIVFTVLSKAGKQGESLTYAEAKDILQSAGCAMEVCDKAASLLEKVESLRYGGNLMNDRDKEHLLDETKRLLEALK